MKYVDIGIVAVKDNDFLQACIESVKRYTSAVEYDLIVQIGEQPEAKNVNELFRKSTAPYLVYLNDDVEILDKNWLFYLLSVARITSVGIVGCAEIYNQLDKQLYLASPEIFNGMITGNPLRRASWIASYLFCIARHRIPTDLMFDENIPIDYPFCGKGMTDVQFCFQVRSQNLAILKDYRFRVYHHHKNETPEQYEARMRLYPEQMEYMTSYWEGTDINFIQDYHEGAAASQEL